MLRAIARCVVLLMLVALPPASSFAQAQHESSDDPRVRRAAREKAIATLGPGARPFVEAYGENAIAAIGACSRHVALKLVAFYDSGQLNRLARPGKLLAVISDPRHRDDVALWAIEHAAELNDPDSLEAYLSDPLEYALGLKALEAGAARMRTMRLNRAVMAATPAPARDAPHWKALLDDDRVGVTACACAVIILAIVLWRNRRA